MSVPERSRILSSAFCVPPTVVTNDDLATVIDTSDEWIRQRSGICERHYIDNDSGSVGLAEEAARDAIERAGLSIADIDLVICATLSPDIDFPGNSALLCDRLGIKGRPAFDVRNQCSGFIYSLSTADAYIRTGGASNVLVVGSEIHSSGLEFNDRGRAVTVLFGDGAGAVVMGPSADPNRGLLTFNLHAEGRYADKLWVADPSCSRKPRFSSTDDAVAAGMFPQMDGRYVFRHAVTRMCESVGEALDSVGLTTADIGVVIPHQANLRINEFVAKTLGLGSDQVVNNIDRYGNTTAATIPILLTETLDAGRINDGDLVCLTAFGAGFTWATALIRW